MANNSNFDGPSCLSEASKPDKYSKMMGLPLEVAYDTLASIEIKTNVVGSC